MKIEKMRAKLAKYEEAYRAARREYGTALAAEITRMHASDLPEEKVRKIRSKGKRRGNDTLDLAPAAKARRKRGGPKASGAAPATPPSVSTPSAKHKRDPGPKDRKASTYAEASYAPAIRSFTRVVPGHLPIKAKATISTSGKRGPGRPRMTPAQKLAARAERQAKLMTMGELGSMAAMDDQISQYDADAEMAARHAQ